MEKKQKPTIAIVGGGPGGLVLARILETRGLEPVVFERDASRVARPQGGPLDIHGDTGQHALRVAGLEAEFRKIARYEDQAVRIYDRTGKLLFSEGEEAAEGDRPEVDRGDLREILLDSLAPDTVRWGRRLMEVSPREDGAYDLRFDHGAVETFDIVVGADGAWSRVRALLSDAVPIDTGVVLVELEIAVADPRHAKAASLVGEGTMFALGNSRGILAHRLGNRDIHVYAAMRSSDVPAAALAKPEKTMATLSTHFAGWAPELRTLIAQNTGSVAVRRLYVLPAEHRWTHQTGLTLLGDAAHLISPFTGEGANLAMLDAVELAAALSADDWDTEVRNYEQAMFARMPPLAIEANESLQEAISEDGGNAMLRQFLSHGPPPI